MFSKRTITNRDDFSLPQRSPFKTPKKVLFLSPCADQQIYSISTSRSEQPLLPVNARSIENQPIDLLNHAACDYLDLSSPAPIRGSILHESSLLLSASPFKKMNLYSSQVATPSTLLSHWSHRKATGRVPLKALNTAFSPPSSPKLPLSKKKRSSLNSPRSNLFNYFSSTSQVTAPSLTPLRISACLGLQRTVSLITNEDDFILGNAAKHSPIPEMSLKANLITPAVTPLDQALLENCVIAGNECGDPMEQTCTGDRCQLPYVETGKDALKRMSPDTLLHLISGSYDHLYDEKYIIDCRFPYEYEGGHIQTAININTMDKLEEFLLSNPQNNKRVILVFHCEFSSHRAPRMALHLRRQDRERNMANYPKLFYPEIYILKGGYKDFYLTNTAFCEPQDYVEMNSYSYKTELRQEMSKFKKSWKRSKSFSHIPSSRNAMLGTEKTPIRRNLSEVLTDLDGTFTFSEDDLTPSLDLDTFQDASLRNCSFYFNAKS